MISFAQYTFRLNNFARDNSAAIPLVLTIDCSLEHVSFDIHHRLHSPVLEIHDALRINASLPSLLGALCIANILVPF